MSPRLAVAAMLALAGFLAGAVFLWPRGRDVGCEAHVTPTGALAAYARMIEHDVERSADGTREETWSDPANGRSHMLSFDANGRLRTASELTQVGSYAHTVWVTYPSRIWQTEQQRQRVSARPSANRAADLAQTNRAKVADGSARIVGREPIDGHEALRLRETLHYSRGQFTIDRWVDPDTYVTLRYDVGSGKAYTTTREYWLPRTRANVAKTRLVIPPGFRHVPLRGGILIAVSSRC